MSFIKSLDWLFGGEGHNNIIEEDRDYIKNPPDTLIELPLIGNFTKEDTLSNIPEIITVVLRYVQQKNYFLFLWLTLWVGRS